MVEDPECTTMLWSRQQIAAVSSYGAAQFMTPLPTPCWWIQFPHISPSAVVCGFCQSVGGKKATGLADAGNNTDWMSSWSAEMTTVSTWCAQGGTQDFLCSYSNSTPSLQLPNSPCHSQYSLFSNRKALRHKALRHSCVNIWYEMLKCPVSGSL